VHSGAIHPQRQSGPTLHSLSTILAVGLAVLVGCTSTSEISSTDNLADRARRLHQSALVVDGHNDVLCSVLDWKFDLEGCGAPRDGAVYDYSGRRPAPADGRIYTQTDLPRFRRGGMDAQFFSIYPRRTFIDRTVAEGGAAAHRTLDLIDALQRQIRLHPNEMELAVSVADIRRITARGKLAALLGIEGGHAIENSLGLLRQFHRLGVRYLTLTHVNTLDWADSSGDLDDPAVQRHHGLTDFGREVVREMNRLGMMIDISHVSDETFADVIEVTRAPVIASHSSCRALVDHPRNLTDDMLRALARNGGIVMINFAQTFIDSRLSAFRREASEKERELRAQFPNDAERRRNEMGAFWKAHRPSPPPVSALIDHIDHAVRMAGVEHVGLGSDFDGEIIPPEGLEDVAGFPRITEELLRRGYSERHVRLILGENLLRVMTAVETTARESQ
jgi:membrane dipeptidase